MMDDREGWNNAYGVMAAKRARRGDFTAIYERVRAGITLTEDEQHLKEQHERGVKQKRGPKDIQTDFQTYATWRWLNEIEKLSKTAAYSLLGDMTGRTADAIKATITRTIKANNLGKNIGDHSFDSFTKANEKPPLLHHRNKEWRCIGCGAFECSCGEGSPRPDWDASPGGITARMLVSFQRG